MGPLYLGIYFTHGRDIAWSLSTSGNAPHAAAATPVPSPVPLPGGMWLMIGGLAVLAAAARRNDLEKVASRA